MSKERELLQELVDAWPQFDGPPDEDLSISGADMVDWVCQFRERVKEVLACSAASCS